MARTIKAMRDKILAEMPEKIGTEKTTAGGIILTEKDGTEEAIDTILYATGFSANNKPFLCDLDALDADGIPIEHQGVSSSVDGLYYIGLEGQIAPASATLRGVSRDARYIAEKVATQLSVC